MITLYILMAVYFAIACIMFGIIGIIFKFEPKDDWKHLVYSLLWPVMVLVMIGVFIGTLIK